MVRNSISLIEDITQLILNSPKRHLVFQRIQTDSAPDASNLRPLCPTRWTVRTGSINSILENYQVLIETFQEISATSKNEYRAKAEGIARKLQEFGTFFALKLCSAVFSVSEQVSCVLQSKQANVQIAVNQAAVLTAHFTRLRSETEFQLFYQNVLSASAELTEEPELPRRRKIPKRFDPQRTQHNFQSPEELYPQQYFKVLDLLKEETTRRPWASTGFFPEGGRIFLKILRLIWVHFCNQEKIYFPCMSTL